MEYAYYAVDKSTWLDKLFNKFFPYGSDPKKENDKRTYITTHVSVNIGWVDLARILVFRKLFIRVTTYTDVLVNEAESLTDISVR